MKRIHLLAAEIFRYSYPNYNDHLGINERFDKIMPKDAKMLETAVREKWDIEKVAEKLQVTTEVANQALVATCEALDIIDAKSPVESFKIAVAYSIRYALVEGIESEDDIMKLAEQICYRAADLALLLELENKSLTHYSKELRDTPIREEVV